MARRSLRNEGGKMRVFLGTAVSAICWLCILGFVQAFELVAPEEPPGEPAIVNGTAAVSPRDFPASFVFQTDKNCTSTAVGSRVILTAAHCLAGAETGTVTIGDNRLGVACTPHPDYGGQSLSADYALCVADADMEGIDFESIGTSLAHPRVGEEVVLLGFGCAEPLGRDRTFGTLRSGRTKVVAAVSTPSDQNILTRGNAALCFGDSGGAAFFELDRFGARRVIIGVNSRSDINSTSELAATSTFQFLDWAVAWSNDNGVAICGIHTSAERCR
jgi:hypothetical protein